MSAIETKAQRSLEVAKRTVCSALKG